MNNSPLHSFGQVGFLAWPVGALHVYRVELWGGHYIATYANEKDAQARAMAESVRSRYDARVIPISRSA